MGRGPEQSWVVKECLEMREEGGRQGCMQLISSDLKRCEGSGILEKVREKKKKFESSVNDTECQF